MIRDLSQSLKGILTQPGLPSELAAALVSFDRPSEPFNPATPTVNLFLYDLRENAELRFNEPSVVRSGGTATIAQPPRRLLCSYLATAWVNSGTDTLLQEHRLLAQVYAAFARSPVVPPSLAVGSIKASDPPVPITVAAGMTATGTSEFWSALGAKLRPSLTVQATLALPIDFLRTEPLSITGRVDMEYIQLSEPGAQPESRYFIAGRVTDADGSPVAKAQVSLVGAGLRTEADDHGVFRLGPMTEGSYTLQAAAGTLQKQIACKVPTPKGTTYDLVLS